MPFLVVTATFTAVPVLAAMGMSLTDITSRDIRTPFAVDFIGFENFVRVLGDAGFQRSMLNTALFVVLCVPLSAGLGLVLALLLDKGIRRLRTFFRAAAYLPVITNIVAAAVIWQYAFAPLGPVNAALEGIGAAGPNWLGDPVWAVATVVMLAVWRNVGTCMVLFLAGLQAIPQQVYEAAAVDGATAARRFRSITLPLLRPATLLVVVLMTVSFLSIFEEPYLLTAGGPLGSTRSIALWIYQQFGFGNTAISMAGSFLLIVFVSIVAVVQFRLLRPKH
ncbi:sugar ABC transporter permease [Microbacterium sp. zg.Y1090]|uniref:carbohydrate ABC transporter permease n=1 Tax=Microbacterium TaxID=33882 RepID=UPI00214B6C2A|nr:MULTISPECIES: sugar ABC transporter permease [unclassified Microbacterium]MCR2812592.1 sugar ABC transporter permease [Microbacterium sp. zg.Y1084]MCR2817612.1 sugar ABC transporter permease [Microbacterium sp. zg.Y1090]MDL5485745.1 sugar ABC transporter permease [Microbacterium sp. zg-Y1211]WIM28912.1 sugar ABC transporter permease [Microbacterium sp. zg-Y1090]